MNLQNPKKFKLLIDQAHQVAINVLRPDLPKIRQS